MATTSVTNILFQEALAIKLPPVREDFAGDGMFTTPLYVITQMI